MNVYSVIVSSMKELEWNKEFQGHKDMVISFMKRFYTIDEYPVSVTENLDENQILFQGKSRQVSICEPKEDGSFKAVEILLNNGKELEFVCSAKKTYFNCSWKDENSKSLWHWFAGSVKGNKHLQMIEEILELMDNIKEALVDGKDFSPTSIISMVTNTLRITEDELEYLGSTVVVIKNYQIEFAKKKHGRVSMEKSSTDCVMYQNGDFEMIESEPKQQIEKIAMSNVKDEDCLEYINDYFKNGRKAIIEFLHEIALYNEARK